MRVTLLSQLQFSWQVPGAVYGPLWPAQCPLAFAGVKGRRIRELTSVVQKRFKFPEGSVELYAEKVANRGLCSIAQAESLRYKLLGGLAVRRCASSMRTILPAGFCLTALASWAQRHNLFVESSDCACNLAGNAWKEAYGQQGCVQTDMSPCVQGVLRRAALHHGERREGVRGDRQRQAARAARQGHEVQGRLHDCLWQPGERLY